MKYDDASWHNGGDFPDDSPEEYGGTHIALFLKWCFIKGWAGDIHLKDSKEDVQRVIKGIISATEYLFHYCDGQLTDEDLNEEGNAFASEYYGDDGLYLDDYANAFENLMYEKPEEEHDFKKFSLMINKRFESGVLTSPTNEEPEASWKFW